MWHTVCLYIKGVVCDCVSNHCGISGYPNPLGPLPAMPRHKRTGGYGVNFYHISTGSSISQPRKEEELFLHAAEVGDIPSVRQMLQDNPELNVNCVDILGRTPLRLAVGNEHLEVSTI